MLGRDPDHVWDRDRGHSFALRHRRPRRGSCSSESFELLSEEDDDHKEKKAKEEGKKKNGDGEGSSTTGSKRKKKPWMLILGCG